MKHPLLSLLVAGIFAAAGTAAAQNVSPEDQEKAGGQTTNSDAAKDTKQSGSSNSDAATNTEQSDAMTAKADYTAAKAKAEADYTAAKAKCDSMQGDAMKTCMSDAKSARSDALAMAKTQNTKQQ